MPRLLARKIHPSHKVLHYAGIPCVDYGTKRIGLAWADDLGISLPLESIPGLNWKVVGKSLQELWGARCNEIVVGYPIHMDGEVGMRAREVDTFITKLTQGLSSQCTE